MSPVMPVRASAFGHVQRSLSAFQQWEVSSGHRSRAVPDRGAPPYSQFGGRFGDTASCTPIARRTMPVMSVTGGPCSRRAAT